MMHTYYRDDNKCVYEMNKIGFKPLIIKVSGTLDKAITAQINKNTAKYE